nr:EOG090X081J [Lepidurus arcticus]
MQAALNYNHSLCQHERFEDQAWITQGKREYRCLGQWTENGLTYTFTQRRDVIGYECFAGVIVTDGELVIKEAGENCLRDVEPMKMGMKLTRQASCYSPRQPAPGSNIPLNNRPADNGRFSTSQPFDHPTTKPWKPITVCFVPQVESLGKIIYAVNAGGDSHTDIFGIHYEADNLNVGTASDYGTHLLNIGRIPQADGILYQTERYHTSTFGYDIPITQDGDYVLVLKFCEVYFTAPNMKVFDVVLNGVHTIVSYLDIFEKVGRGIAYDEYIPFRVQKGKVMVNNEESDLANKKIRVEFIKGYRDNPKVNAIFVMKGKLEDVPKLPPMPSDEEEIDDIPNKVEEPKADAKKRKPSGPRASDPYAADQSSSMIPIFVAVGCFLPVLFCLCKL